MSGFNSWRTGRPFWSIPTHLDALQDTAHRDLKGGRPAITFRSFDKTKALRGENVKMVMIDEIQYPELPKCEQPM